MLYRSNPSYPQCQCSSQVLLKTNFGLKLTVWLNPRWRQVSFEWHEYNSVSHKGLVCQNLETMCWWMYSKNHTLTW